MTDEMNLLGQLFADDITPGPRAVASLENRTGYRAEAEAKAVDISLVAEGGGPSSPPRQVRHLRRLVVVGLVASVLVAFGVVAQGELSQRSAVQGALSSLFAGPTLQVSFSYTEPGGSSCDDRVDDGCAMSVMSTSTSSPAQAGSSSPASTSPSSRTSATSLPAPPTTKTGGQPTIGGAGAVATSGYTVVLTVASRDMSQPLSSNDGVDNLELSVYQGPNEVADFVVADGAVYARLDLAVASPADLARAQRSILARVTGQTYAVTKALLEDRWIEMDDTSFRTAAGSSGASTTGSDLAALRSQAVMSWAQSWDAWSSLKTIPTGNTTSSYSLTLPARSFLAAFIGDIDSALGRDAAGLNSLLGWGPVLVDQVPPRADIPIVMQVDDGVLTGLEVMPATSVIGGLRGLEIQISHPGAGVSAPRGAVSMSSGDISTLEGDYACAQPGSTYSWVHAGSSCYFPLLLVPLAGVVPGLFDQCRLDVTAVIPPKGSAVPVTYKAVVACQGAFTNPPPPNQVSTSTTPEASTTTPSPPG